MPSRNPLAGCAGGSHFLWCLRCMLSVEDDWSDSVCWLQLFGIATRTGEARRKRPGKDRKTHSRWCSR